MNNEQTRTSGRGRESDSPGAHLGLTRTAAATTRTAAATKGDRRGTAVSAAAADRAAAGVRRGWIIVVRWTTVDCVATITNDNTYKNGGILTSVSVVSQPHDRVRTSTQFHSICLD